MSDGSISDEKARMSSGAMLHLNCSSENCDLRICLCRFMPYWTISLNSFFKSSSDLNNGDDSGWNHKTPFNIKRINFIALSRTWRCCVFLDHILQITGRSSGQASILYGSSTRAVKLKNVKARVGLCYISCKGSRERVWEVIYNGDMSVREGLWSRTESLIGSMIEHRVPDWQPVQISGTCSDDMTGLFTRYNCFCAIQVLIR
jgi:hypothetical protein